VRAKIFLDGDFLVGELDDGHRLSHADAESLADLLWTHGVTSAQVLMIDWHQDAARAPMSGQRIAIYQRLRLHEQSEG